MPASASRAIAEETRGRYLISDWSRRHGNFFRSIQVTKSIMFFVLLLVVAVAAFNIISTLVMVVKEKRADIAILRTLGASPRDMLTIFMVQGTVIGVVGTAAGVALGLLVSVNITAIVARPRARRRQRRWSIRACTSSPNCPPRSATAEVLVIGGTGARALHRWQPSILPGARDDAARRGAAARGLKPKS